MNWHHSMSFTFFLSTFITKMHFFFFFVVVLKLLLEKHWEASRFKNYVFVKKKKIFFYSFWNFNFSQITNVLLIFFNYVALSLYRVISSRPFYLWSSNQSGWQWLMGIASPALSPLIVDNHGQITHILIAVYFFWKTFWKICSEIVHRINPARESSFP